MIEDNYTEEAWAHIYTDGSTSDAVKKTQKQMHIFKIYNQGHVRKQLV